jgi:hypothetical protein
MVCVSVGISTLPRKEEPPAIRSFGRRSREIIRRGYVFI